jgi:hypothetical protein
VNAAMALTLLLAGFILGSNQLFALTYLPDTRNLSVGESSNTIFDNKIEESDKATLPSNVFMPRYFQIVFHELLNRSITFKHQCRQINATHKLRITIQFHPSLPNRFRSLSKVRRTKNDYIIIVVQVALTSDYVEMLGHEFEHALEQVEGLNLQELSKLKKCRVYRQWNGSYETERAIQAGRTVSNEFYSFRNGEKLKKK